MKSLDVPPKPLEILGLRLRIGPTADDAVADGRAGADSGGISLHLEAGTILAVLGEDGSGKGELLNAITGTLQPDGGTIRVYGHDLADRRERRAARLRMGVVFQRPALLGGLTVAGNVELPLRATRETLCRMSPKDEQDEVNCLLELVGAFGERDSYPDKSMSEGMQRRVALARALAGRRRLLLAQDVTAGLSPQLAFQIGELIHSLVGRGIIDAAVLFTHHVNEARQFANRYVLLQSGARMVNILTERMIGEMEKDEAIQRFLPPAKVQTSRRSGAQQERNQAVSS